VNLQAASSAHILVVDDDPDIIEVLSHVLERRGYRVRTAENGREGIELARQSIPSLVLLDLMMPVMTGIEFLEEVAKDETLAGVPIMVMSAWAEEGARFKNVSAVIRKPFDLRQLLDRIEDCLGR
jgi:adenylate cyclase